MYYLCIVNQGARQRSHGKGSKYPSHNQVKSPTMIQESKNTATSLRREVAEALELLRKLSTKADYYVSAVDKAKPSAPVTITYVAEIYERAERIQAAVRTVKKFPHLIELAQDQEGDLRKLHNRLNKILRSAGREYCKIMG